MTSPRRRYPDVLLILGLVLTCLGCAATPPAPAPAPARPVRVGSWNIEWLDQPGLRSGPARGVQQSADDLADYIAASGVSVLALQELTMNAPDGSPRNVTISAALGILNDEHGTSWRHVVFPSARNQNVGVAWDENVVTPVSDIEGSPVPIDRAAFDDGDSLWSRPPRSLFFTAGDGMTDFVIIPVHMKSNYGGDFSARRAHEAQALGTALPEVRATFRDQDVFVIGDTNSPHHADESIMAFEHAGLTDLNHDDDITYWRGSALDRALVPADQPEFASPRFEVFFDRYAEENGISVEDFKVRWSDHRMVVFTLRVMPDDD